MATLLESKGSRLMANDWWEDVFSELKDIETIAAACGDAEQR